MIVERSMSRRLAVQHLPRRGRAGRRRASWSTPAARSTPLLAKADEHGLDVTHVLLTHHHHDHVAELGAVLERWPDAAVLVHPEERDSSPARPATSSPATSSTIGGLTRRGAAHARPHARGCSRCSSTARRVHRRHAVQGLGRRRARARAHDLRRPQALDHGRAARAAAARRRSAPATPTRRRSPTSSSTTAFVRIWRGLDPEGDEPCTALGEPATLVLLGDDYDGGHKAWVRWPDGARRHRARARRVER